MIGDYREVLTRSDSVAVFSLSAQVAGAGDDSLVARWREGGPRQFLGPPYAL